jgi:hypothetical protein
MALIRFRFSWTNLYVLFLSLCSLFQCAYQQNYFTTTDAQGNTIVLSDDRKPALYTQHFGDCLGNSVVNVTRFDAAYYSDNMTVLFHLVGATNIKNESLMSMYTSLKSLLMRLLTSSAVHIGVFACKKTLHMSLVSY